MKFIAIAYYHDQPPVDSPAKRYKKTKSFGPLAMLEDVYKWAAVPNVTYSPVLVRLEIHPDEDSP